MTDKRLIELESRLAFMDENLEALSAALSGQQRRIDGLERQCRELVDRLLGMDEPARPRSPEEERPPHY